MKLTAYIGESKEQRILFLARHRGLIADVARSCDVNVATVSQVFHGKKTSKRVEAALVHEIERRFGRLERKAS